MNNETLLTDSSDRTKVREQARELFAQADRIMVEVQALDDAGRNEEGDRLYSQVMMLDAQALRLTNLYL